MVEIKENGDIFCHSNNGDFMIAARNGPIMEFKRKSYNEKYMKVKDSQFLSKSHDIFPTTATEFWAREKTVVQNALLCCKVRLTQYMITHFDVFF